MIDMQRVCTLSLMILLFTITACSSPDQTATESPEPAEFSNADFAAWSALEGSWVVTDEVIRFYEKYELPNDTTIRILYFFDDSTLTRATDTASVIFTDGKIFHHDKNEVCVATRGDSVSIEFVALEDTAFSFSWFRETDDRWRLSVQAGDEDSNEYRLERINPN